jgi:hypothetical protein
MACEVVSMNSFRSGIEGVGGKGSGPVMPAKKPSGAREDAGLTSVAVAREEVRRADHRDDDRHRLASEKAKLKAGRKNHVVDLINLSGGGAMVRTDAPLAMWQRVTLLLGDCDGLECAVRWIRGDRVGLEFAPETQVGGSDEDRAAMLLSVVRRSFPSARKAPKPPEPLRDSEPKGQVDARHRRADVRHPLIWSGDILFNHDCIPARLRNISATGALTECDAVFPPNAEVLLDLGEAGQHFARVSWSRGDQVGLKFAKPFDIALLARERPTPIPNQKWQAPDYLAKGNGASGWGSDWDHASIDQLRDDLEGYIKR